MGAGGERIPPPRHHSISLHFWVQFPITGQAWEKQRGTPLGQLDAEVCFNTKECLVVSWLAGEDSCIT